MRPYRKENTQEALNWYQDCRCRVSRVFLQMKRSKVKGKNCEDHYHINHINVVLSPLIANKKPCNAKRSVYWVRNTPNIIITDRPLYTLSTVSHWAFPVAAAPKAREGRVRRVKNLELRSEIVYGVYENQRIILHDNTWFLTLTHCWKTQKIVPDCLHRPYLERTTVKRHVTSHRVFCSRLKIHVFSHSFHDYMSVVPVKWLLSLSNRLMSLYGYKFTYLLTCC